MSLFGCLTTTICLILMLSPCFCGLKAGEKAVKRWEVLELSLKYEGKAENPFTEVEAIIELHSPDGKTVKSLGYYDDNGIDACRTDKINTIWSWAFTSDENDALAYIIEEWKSMLGDRDYREWGQPLEVGNIWRMGDSLYDYGVDLFSLTSPTTNVTTTSTQIIGTGTLNITVV